MSVGQRSTSQWLEEWKTFPLNNLSTLWARAFKHHRVVALIDVHIYICACSSYLNKCFRFKTVISRSLPSFNSAHGGTRGGGERHAFFSKTSSFSWCEWGRTLNPWASSQVFYHWAKFLSLVFILWTLLKWTFSVRPRHFTQNIRLFYDARIYHTRVREETNKKNTTTLTQASLLRATSDVQTILSRC